MKKNINQSGFSLVELIVAIAIASVVLMAGTRLLTTVLNQYSKDNYDIKLQNEVSEINNLLENWVMGAVSVEVSEDNKTLTVTKIKEGVDTLQTFTSSVYLSNNKLYYNNQAGTPVYLGNFVDSVAFYKSKSESAVYVALNMKYGSSTYSITRKIILRNAENGAGTGAGTGTGDSGSTVPEIVIPPTQEAEPEVPEGGSSTAATTEATTEAPTQAPTQAPTASSSATPTTESATTTEATTQASETSESLNPGTPELAVEHAYVNNNGGKQLTTYINNRKSPNGDLKLVKVRYYYLYTGAPQNVGLARNTIQINGIDMGVYTNNFDSTYHINDTDYNLGFVELNFNRAFNLYNLNFDNTVLNANIITNFNDGFYPFDLSGKNAVCVYYNGELVCGEEPRCKDVNFIVEDNTTTTENGKHTVSLTVKKQGMDINWSDLELTYYVKESSDTPIQVSNVAVTSSEGGPSAVTYNIQHVDTPTINYVNAEGRVKLSFTDASDNSAEFEETTTITFEINGDIDIENSYSNNSTDNVYGVYGLDNEGNFIKEFGDQPTEKQNVEVKYDLITNVELGRYYKMDKPIKQIIVNYTITDQWYGAVTVYYGNYNQNKAMQYTSGGTYTNVPFEFPLDQDGKKIEQFQLNCYNATVDKVFVIYE